MATHSSILVWRIPWTEEPGGLQSMGLQRVRHDWAHTHTFLIVLLWGLKVIYYIHIECILYIDKIYEFCVYTHTHTHTHTHWRRERQPTPVLLLEEFHGWRRLVGCSPRGCKESKWLSDLHTHTHTCISQYLIKVSYYYYDAILLTSHFALLLFSVPLKNMLNSKVSCRKADTIFLKALLMAWN